MQKAYLIRDDMTPLCTGGTLVLNGHLIRTMELPWNDNKTNSSCIPPGEYIVRYLPKSYSGRYRDVYAVSNVTSRTGILFHSGNTTKDTRGCILPGLKRGKLGTFSAVLSSKLAMRKLHRAAGRKSFKLTIIND